MLRIERILKDILQIRSISNIFLLFFHCLSSIESKRRWKDQNNRPKWTSISFQWFSFSFSFKRSKEKKRDVPSNYNNKRIQNWWKSARLNFTLIWIYFVLMSFEWFSKMLKTKISICPRRSTENITDVPKKGRRHEHPL